MIAGVPGPRNCLTDVSGIQVGHHTLIGEGRLTGTTAILAPTGGMTAGVDVRGGGPGTRETDLLDPTAAMQKIHAIVLTGGSAFGLAAASGAAAELADSGVGFPIGPDAEDVVPIVPAAVLFDLGRGGRFRATPGEQDGRAAVIAARAGVPSAQGNVGAGTGAAVASLKGGVGVASVRLESGATVAALVVVNAMGSPTDALTGVLSGSRQLLPGDAVDLEPPAPVEVPAVLEASRPRAVLATDLDAQAVQNTTIGVIATDADLTKAQCTKLAGIAHDGLARSLNPVHTLFDGDTLFGLATGTRPIPDLTELHEILCVAADVVTRAVVRGILAAETVETSAGRWPSYTELTVGAPAAT